jgi:hypothetical protein
LKANALHAFVAKIVPIEQGILVVSLFISKLVIFGVTTFQNQARTWKLLYVK